MSNLYKYLKRYKKESIFAPLGKLFEATLELIVPLIIASIIDKGIGNNNNTHIITMSLLLVTLGFIGLVFSVVAQYFAAKASVGFITDVKHAMFSKIQSLSYSDIDNIGTSTMITRMTSDSSRVQTGLNLALRLLLRSPFVVFGAMIMALSIDVSAGLTFAVVIPLLSLVVFGIMLISMPLYKKVQSGIDKILSKTRDNLSGVRVIRAFGKEEYEKTDFRAYNSALTKEQTYVGKISALMNPLTYIIINLGIVFLIYIGAIRVNLGDLTQGEVIALYNYMSQILIELVKLANLIITISKAVASGSRISSVFDINPSQEYGERESGNGEKCIVKFTNVSLKYPKSTENALEEITFEVLRGETVGIIGGTGSGKTSLINLIPRFYDATGGHILIDGAPISEYSRSSLLQMIGIVPQGAVLFSGSIAENMRFGNENATDEEIIGALKTSQSYDFVFEKDGLNTHVEAGGKNFSGGQRQRLTIARALVKQPEILILDDSASALDYATDACLRKALSKLQNTTIFVVSQRAASVMHADKIIVLDDGRLVALGKHEDLLSSCDVYREIYDTQFGEAIK